MKIKSIQLKDHPVLKNLKVDFCDKQGNVQNLIVIAGTNGSGKTNLLESIYDYFVKRKNFSGEVNVEFSENEKKLTKNFNNQNFRGKQDEIFHQLDLYNYYKENNIMNESIRDAKELPKIIYMPVEINFSELKDVNDKFKYEYKFINKIDNKIVSDIPSYLATRMKLLQKTNENLTYKEIKEKISDETNEVFKNIELDLKMIGFTKDEKDLPLFKNSYGEIFDINKLSSGEKQLFLRALTLKMIKAENAVILIDEPEISLHPKWQQRVIKVYENIGENNQIIIATHSPHILSSVSNDKIRIMSKSIEGINIKRHEELTYGQSIETILEDVMEIEDKITPDVAQKFKVLHEMIKEGGFEKEEFKIKLRELSEDVGPHNEELLLLNLALNIAKRRV